MIDKEPYVSCEECQLMWGTTLFTEAEITDYHEGKIGLENFDKSTQEIITELFESLDDEDAD